MLKISLLFILCFSIYNSVSYADEEYDNESQQETKNKEENNDSILFRDGFYTGLNIGWSSKKIETELEKPETDKNKDNKINIKKNGANAGMLIGYNKLFGQMIIGGEFEVGKRFGTTIPYKYKDIKIAEISDRLNYTGLVKLGVAIGSWGVYGTIGGNLSSLNYKWKQEKHPDIGKTNNINLAYGAMVEKEFNNRVFLRVGYSRLHPSECSDTAVKVATTDKKLDNISMSNHEVSLTLGYKF